MTNNTVMNNSLSVQCDGFECSLSRETKGTSTDGRALCQNQGLGHTAGGDRVTFWQHYQQINA